MVKHNPRILVVAMSAMFAVSAFAAVSAEEAKLLGGPELTEWGAERAGNKEGTIPAWTGEKVKAPASYDPKQPERTPDPFGDKPLYSITAQNMAQHSDRLTIGLKEMFKKYPNFRMDIYKTNRTVLYPKSVIDNTLKNATSAKATNGGIKLEGAYGGVPFPIPKTGNEVIWNHLLARMPSGIAGKVQSWIVDANGAPVLQGLQDVNYTFPYWNQDIPGIRAPDSKYWMLRFETLNPARKVGEKYIIISPLDPINPGQRAYVYVPGQRRVKLAPDLAYDTPSPASGGASTMDEQQTFLGAQDRFNFKILGKKERYLVYNNNLGTDYKLCPPEKALTKNFINPDCVRWELHRTWEIEATVKPGFRNVMPKRTMYLDEDWSGSAIGDMYDAAGKLYRVDIAPTTLVYQYDQQYNRRNDSWTYDLQTGITAISSWVGFQGGGFQNVKPKPDVFFSPDALAGEGIR